MKHLAPFVGKCLGLVPVVGALLFSPPAFAEDGLPPGYPSKPIELVIPFAPGGGVDLFGRTVARILNEEHIVPQQIQVTNQPGAGGSLGIASMVQRNGDPYSLLGIAIHIVVTPIMLGTPNTFRDVTPLAKLFADYEMVVVQMDSPIKTLKDIADALKKDPAGLRIGGASLGSGDHLAISRFAQSLGVDPAKLTYIPYSGGETNAAILNGHVDIGVGGLDVIDLVKAGKVRALAISAPHRLNGDFRDVPTFTEQGVDLVSENWRGIFAPPGLPRAVVKYWQDAFAMMVQTDAWKKEVETYQWVPMFETDTFSASLTRDDATYRRLLQQLHLIR